MGVEAADNEIIGESFATPETFGRIFDRYVVSIHKFFFHRVGKQQADDLLAETFRIAFERRDSYDLTRSNARPWLYGIANNTLLHFYRKSGRRQLAYKKFQHLRVVDPEPFQRVDEIDAANMILPRVLEIIKKLPSRDRDVVLLYAWDNLSYEEIAETLNIPVGTVRSRLNRVRKKIRELDEYIGKELFNKQVIS